jgi:5-deoxy-glucuronate isomerase
MLSAYNFVHHVAPPTTLEIRAVIDGELAIPEAPGDPNRQAQCVAITSEMVREVQHGVQNYKRKAYEILTSSIDANMLLVGETISEPGNWSSFPPHKHDTDNLPQESKLQEVYYFKMNPPGGFGFQRVYADEHSLDITYLVEDDLVVPIPCGYHPVVSAPGYSHYYLWILAGSKRVLKPYFDPNYSWLCPS